MKLCVKVIHVSFYLLAFWLAFNNTVLHTFNRVQGKPEKVREFESSGENIIFEKVNERSGKIENWCHQMSDFQAKLHKI